MNEFVPLKKAFEQNRYKDVVSGTLLAIKQGVLNSSEIIQFIELAIEAIERDKSNKKDEVFLLKKIAKAYLDVQKYSKAKQVYKKLTTKDPCWENMHGLLLTLASNGEIEEVKKIVKDILPKITIEKNTIYLKRLNEFLKEFKLVSDLQEDIENKLRKIEGNYKEIKRISIITDDAHFIKDANWQNNEKSAEEIFEQLLSQGNIARKLLTKRFFQVFIKFGENKKILEQLLKYFEKTGSQHIGHFFKENSGLKVELEDKEWITEAFKKAIVLDKPKEIDVELDLAEDLFSESGSKEEMVFNKIKSIENRITFLLNNSKLDDAKRLNDELMAIDPANTTFKDRFREKDLSYKKKEHSDDWESVLKTLDEINVFAKGFESKEEVNKLSWKLITDEDLKNNYLEYSYALILAGQETDCIELLNKVLVVDEDSFKEASYLKARCHQSKGENKLAIAIVESIMESCVLSEDELIEMLYVKAECQETLGQNKKAIQTYKKIEKIDSAYRLVRLKIDSLESL